MGCVGVPGGLTGLAMVPRSHCQALRCPSGAAEPMGLGSLLPPQLPTSRGHSWTQTPIPRRPHQTAGAQSRALHLDLISIWKCHKRRDNKISGAGKRAAERRFEKGGVSVVDEDANSQPLSVLHLPASGQAEVSALCHGAPHRAAPTAGCPGCAARLLSRFDAWSRAKQRLSPSVPRSPLRGQAGTLLAMAAFDFWLPEVPLQIEDLQFVPLVRPCNKARGTKTKPKQL